jgi:4-amino-4-deoxy-L-arabinose transferase-like glycosyltransferase
VVVAGLVWRVGYVLLVTRHQNSKLYDAAWYELQGLTLAGGHFFPVLFGRGPEAAHPPLTALVLVPAAYLFGVPPGATPERLTMAILGAVVVALVGILGLVLVGERAGLLAALVGAAYPNLWIPNGIVMSETVSMLTATVVLLTAYRLLRSPTWIAAALVGVACAAAMLTRAELVLLVPAVAVPAALAARQLPRPRRIALAAVAVVMAALVVGPWVGRNLASFRDPTFLSTGLGPVLLGANCPGTYAGPLLGGWSITCSLDVRAGADQSVTSSRQTAKALRDVRRHVGRVPVVVAARVGRLWDLYEPLRMIERTTVDEGRPVPASLAGLCSYYLLLPVAVLGVVVLRRRRVPMWPLLAIAGVVTVVAATGYGLVRFRAELEPVLVVLAGVGLDAAWGRARGPTGRRPAGSDRGDTYPELLGRLLGVGHVDGHPGAHLEPGHGGGLGPHVDVPVEGLAHPVGSGVEDEVVGDVADHVVELAEATLERQPHRHQILGGTAVEVGAVTARDHQHLVRGGAPERAYHDHAVVGVDDSMALGLLRFDGGAQQAAPRELSEARLLLGELAGHERHSQQLPVGMLDRGARLPPGVHDGLAVPEVGELGVLLDPVPDGRHHQLGLLVGEHRPRRIVLGREHQHLVDPASGGLGKDGPAVGDHERLVA